MRFALIHRHLIIAIAISFGTVLMGWWLFRPSQLTQTYGPELREAIQRYREVLSTIDGWRDPAVMAQVTTGDYLDYLVQVKCVDCAGVQVATKTNVQVLQVVEYSATVSKVITRVEWGWHNTDPNTRAILGSCHAQAFTDLYILTWKDNTWKVSGGEEVDANRVDDSPELLAKYCDSN